MENEVEVEGKVYKIQSMNVFTQFHVARRLAALAPAILMYLQTPLEDRNNLVLFYSMTDAFATMPEHDVNYILTNCLNTVLRKQENGWAKIQTESGLMFDDITMPNMLKLTWEVIMKDIASFFPTAPLNLDAVKNQAN